jgi:hypothetical protein
MVTPSELPRVSGSDDIRNAPGHAATLRRFDYGSAWSYRIVVIAPNRRHPKE